jgi:alpha-1,3-fucosyltransferase 10
LLGLAWRKPAIVFYTGCFGKRPPLADVPLSIRSLFTRRRAYLPEACAVVFHVPDLVADPAVVAEFMKLDKPRGQRWVAWSMESAENYPLMDAPAFARRIDLWMTYRRASDVWTPYIPGEHEWENALKRPPLEKSAAATTAMFQSANFNRSGRLEFAAALMREMEIHSFGRALKNRALSIRDEGRATKLSTIGGYRFCLSLENAIEDDYVTEKFFDPLLVGTVPIYRGAPNADAFAPGANCFIDAAKFTSEAELAAYIRHLDANPEVYAEYLGWRRRPLSPNFRSHLEQLRTPPLARLARLVLGG